MKSIRTFILCALFFGCDGISETEHKPESPSSIQSISGPHITIIGSSMARDANFALFIRDPNRFHDGHKKSGGKGLRQYGDPTNGSGYTSAWKSIPDAAELDTAIFQISHRETDRTEEGDVPYMTAQDSTWLDHFVTRFSEDYPNTKLFIGAQPDYVDMGVPVDPCSTPGSNGIEAANDAADKGALNYANVDRALIFGPLETSQVKRDGCHANWDGRYMQADSMISWLDNM